MTAVLATRPQRGTHTQHAARRQPQRSTRVQPPRTSRRRLALVALVVLAVSLVLCAPALAAAGGGSSGFGGGGGGGGRGAGLYILIQILVRVAIFGHGLGVLIIIGLILAYLMFTNVMPRAQRAWSEQQRAGRSARRRVARRARRVELAAAEAAQDDAAFDPDAVRAAVAEMFTDIQQAWSAGDRKRLRALVGPHLMQEWDRRLGDFAARGWHNRVEPLRAPDVRYVGLTRRGEDPEDRIVVRIEAKVRDYVVDRHGNRLTRAGRVSDTVTLREFWTLVRARDTASGWRLLSIEQGAEGRHALDEQIVATPWADTQALRDEAMVEAANADAVPDGTQIAELADLHFDGDARRAALDLSLADGRFAPDVLEISARRAVAAWADAIDGDEAKLRALARRSVIDELLHPGDPSRATRLVVRGPKVKEIRVTGFHPAATPPMMTVEVVIEGRRYLENRATAAVVAGNPARSQTFLERWTLALTGDGEQPWQIIAADSPMAAR